MININKARLDKEDLKEVIDYKAKTGLSMALKLIACLVVLAVASAAACQGEELKCSGVDLNSITSSYGITSWDASALLKQSHKDLKRYAKDTANKMDKDWYCADYESFYIDYDFGSNLHYAVQIKENGKCPMAIRSYVDKDAWMICITDDYPAKVKSTKYFYDLDYNEVLNNMRYFDKYFIREAKDGYSIVYVRRAASYEKN